MQDDQLFAGSIADNIACFDTETSPLSIENAAVNRLAITRIVIVHRPETIASAQRALVVANGAVQPIPPQLHDVGVAG